MATRLKDYQVVKVAFVDAGANQRADVVIYKRDMSKADEPQTGKEPSVADDIKKAEELAARVSELEAEREALTSMSNDDLAVLRGIEVAKAAEPNVDDVIKGLPEDVRKRIEDAEATVAKMNSEMRKRDFIAKAAEYEHVAGAAELGPVLEEIDRLAPNASKSIEQYLKGAEARLASEKLFSEHGAASGATDVSKQDLAQAEITKRVADGQTYEVAMKATFKDHPEWMDETLKVDAAAGGNLDH